MAQAELEEKFKGIGLAEATAKCGLLCHVAHLVVYHKRISVAYPRQVMSVAFVRPASLRAGLQSKTRSSPMSSRLSCQRRVCHHPDVQNNRGPCYMTVLPK